MDEISPDFSRVRVSLQPRWYNRNYLGSQFGGSIYSMTDPFYMLMLNRSLGEGFAAVDVAAGIQFLRPTHGRLSATFTLKPEELSLIRSEAESHGHHLFERRIEVKNESGDVVSTVEKSIYVRKTF